MGEKYVMVFVFVFEVGRPGARRFQSEKNQQGLAALAKEPRVQQAAQASNTVIFTYKRVPPHMVPEELLAPRVAPKGCQPKRPPTEPPTNQAGHHMVPPHVAPRGIPVQLPRGIPVQPPRVIAAGRPPANPASLNITIDNDTGVQTGRHIDVNLRGVFSLL